MNCCTDLIKLLLRLGSVQQEELSWAGETSLLLHALNFLSGGVQPRVFRSLLLLLKKVSTQDSLQVASAGE